MSDRRSNIIPLRPPEPFRPFSASSMTGAPPASPEWVADGLLLRGMVTLLTGSPGIGKSLLTQQLLSAVALGHPWLDKETISVPTFGLFGEDPQDMLERRQLDINAHYDASPHDYEGRYSWDSRDSRDAVMWDHDPRSDKGGPTPLWDQIWQFIAEREIGVVAFDTAAVIFSGNEGWRNHVTPFMRALTMKAVENNCAVVLSAHPAKQTPHGYSGSSAWLGSSRFAFNLGRPKEFDPETGQPALERVVRGLKFNYSAGMTAEKLLWNRGVFIVDGADEAPQKHVMNRLDRAELQYRLLNGMKRVISVGGKLVADELSSSSMPNRARRSGDPTINKIPLNELYRAQAELIAGGQVILVEVDNRCLLRPADGPNYRDEKVWSL